MRDWWAAVPEPDKGILTGSVLLFGSLFLAIFLLALFGTT
jgi:hypothetical protein